MHSTCMYDISMYSIHVHVSTKNMFNRVYVHIQCTVNVHVHVHAISGLCE